MNINSCYGTKLDLFEGEYISADASNEDEDYEVSGITFLSLGVICDKDGFFTNITDLISVNDRRKATEVEIIRALDNFEADPFDDCRAIAKEYIMASNEDDILPIKYRKCTTKEELLTKTNNNDEIKF